MRGYVRWPRRTYTGPRADEAQGGPVVTIAGGRPLVLTSNLDGDAMVRGSDEGPLIDYVELTRAVGGQLSHPRLPGGLLGRLEAKTRPFGDWRQGWRATRSEACGYLSLSEKAALAPALLDRRRPHLAVAHNLTTARRRELQRRTHWLERLHRIVVLCRTQEAYLRGEVGLSAERVRFLYDKVDHRFYSPSDAPPEGYVLSVGQTRRDYATLFEAIRDLRVRTVVVASSPWTGEDSRLSEIPAEVVVRSGLAYRELRDLYDRASVVVVPLEPDLDFAAGVNGVLEAMAMSRPLVVTATPGIADYVEDAVTARLVPAGDAGALQEAIRELLRHRQAAEQLGANARAMVDGGRNLETYVAELGTIFAEVAPMAE